MKKIIEHGKKPNTIKRFICTHCGCVFEADSDEYKHTLDRNEDIWTSECPESKPYDSPSGYHQPYYEHLVDVTTSIDIEGTNGIRIYRPAPGCEFGDLSDSEWAAYKAGCVFDKIPERRYPASRLKRYVLDLGDRTAEITTPYEAIDRFYTLANTCFNIRRSVTVCRIIKTEPVYGPSYERLKFNGIEYVWRRDGARKMISPGRDEEWDLDYCEICVHKGDPQV